MIDPRLPKTNSHSFNIWFMKTSIYDQMYGGVQPIELPIPKIAVRKKAMLEHAEAMLYHVYKVGAEKRYYEKKVDLPNGDYLGISSIPKATVRKKVIIQVGDKVNAPLRRSISAGEYQCCYCDIWLDKTNYTRDHIVPLSLGGENTQANLRPCCSACNNEKGSNTLKMYIIMLNILQGSLKKSDPKFLELSIKIKNANNLAKIFNPCKPK